MSKRWLKYGGVLVYAMFLSWAYLFVPHFFVSLNSDIGDLFFKIRGDIPQSGRVVIVDIDEASLKAFGQWPWPRFRVAELLERLSAAGAGIIGLDIVFSEPDRTSPYRIASKLHIDAQRLENYDTVLAEAFAETPTVGGYFFRFDKKTDGRTPMVPGVVVEKGLRNNRSIMEPRGAVLNIEPLQESLYSSGFFNNIPDPDGMIRSVPLIMRYEGVIYPSLTLEMLRIYSKVHTMTVYGNEMGVEKIVVGGYEIPTDSAGRLFVNYRGGRKHFRYISAADVLGGHFDSAEVAGKFVLVGTSAIALADLRPTPIDIIMPGVEIQANVIDNLLQSDILHKPYTVVIYDLLVIWGIVLLSALLFSVLRSWMILPGAIIAVFLIYRFLYYLFFDQGFVLNLVFPLFAFAGTLIIVVVWDYFYALKQKEFISRMFEKKVSKAVMEDLVKSRRKAVTEAQEKDVAIYFSDIRGFTTLSEEIGSSKKLVDLLNRYMTPMVEEITKREGTVDKFIGDALMAYWNAPNQVDAYVDKAVLSALAQVRMLEGLNDTLEPEFGIRLRIGIGIHCGKVTVGEMGSADRSDYTIVGDNVNLASRLEELNKLYGSTIIISESVRNALQDSYALRTLDIVKVRGKHRAIEIFEVLASSDRESMESLEDYHAALQLYRNREFVKAYAAFKTLNGKHEEKLYRLYIERCKGYLDDPGKRFSPVYES